MKASVTSLLLYIHLSSKNNAFCQLLTSESKFKTQSSAGNSKLIKSIEFTKFVKERVGFELVRGDYLLAGHSGLRIYVEHIRDTCLGVYITD